MIEPRIHEEPYAIGVGEITENDNGTYTYEVHMSDAASATVTELGLKLIFYCAATGTDIQDALDWILKQEGKDD